jgi:hypothetical protein
MSMKDLNEYRPRPVLAGYTAREVFEHNRVCLPDRRRFHLEVDTLQMEIEANTGSRTEKEKARRRAVIAVLSRYNLIKWNGRVSTNLISNSVTN